MPASYVTPLQGLGWEGNSGPRALPWAGMSRPFRANFSIADPTDLLDPSDQSGQSEKKTENGDRISKFLNVTICTPPNSKKSSCFFVSFVVKNLFGRPLINGNVRKSVIEGKCLPMRTAIMFAAGATVIKYIIET